MKYYYTVYKVTNLVTGKFYIGTHKTSDLNDRYMGSGKYLKLSQLKHGMENFEKEILFVFDNSEEMFAKEAEIVTEEFIAENNTYNLKLGGEGGWDKVNKDGRNIYDGHAEQSKVNIIKAHTKLREHRESDDWRKQHGKSISKSLRTYYEDNKGSFTGKQHTEESKKRIGMNSSINQHGNKNSQYGSMWIHSLEEQRNRKIPKDEAIPDGWIKGRKMKF